MPAARRNDRNSCRADPGPSGPDGSGSARPSSGAAVWGMVFYRSSSDPGQGRAGRRDLGLNRVGGLPMPQETGRKGKRAGLLESQGRAADRAVAGPEPGGPEPLVPAASHARAAAGRRAGPREGRLGPSPRGPVPAARSTPARRQPILRVRRGLGLRPGPGPARAGGPRATRGRHPPPRPNRHRRSRSRQPRPAHAGVLRRVRCPGARRGGHARGSPGRVRHPVPGSRRCRGRPACPTGRSTV